MDGVHTCVRIVKREWVINVKIGITGGIATGKSTVSNYLKNLGFLVIDSDEISRNLLNIDGKSYFEVVSYFGNNILNEDKSINRKLLANIIFNNVEKRMVLNKIVHRDVLEQIKIIIDKNQINEIIFIDVPLLYEANYDKFMDKVIVVSCDRSTQIDRLMNRNKIDRNYAEKMIDAQMTIEEKEAKADFVIYNFDINQTYQQIDEIIKNLKGENK